MKQLHRWLWLNRDRCSFRGELVLVESTANFFGFGFGEVLQDFGIRHVGEIHYDFLAGIAKSALSFWCHVIPILVAGIFDADAYFFHVFPIIGDVIRYRSKR